MKKQEKSTDLNLEKFTKEKGVQFGKFVSGWLTPKKLFWFLLIVYLLSLVPLLWIGFYNYPSADDYSIGSDCRQAFVNTHSLLATVWAGIVRAADDWLNWMGYFTSNFLMALPTNTFGERAYVWTSVIMIGALSLSTAYLLKVIFCKVFHADKYLAGSVILMMLFITVQRMQGRVEAFYWYSGAANYILVHSFCMWFYGLLIAAIYDTGKKRTGKLIGASILGFLVGGGNQMTALNGAVVLLVAILCVSLQKKWKNYRAFWWPIGLYYLGFLLNVAAPGNWVRAADASGMNPVKAILVSFYYAFDYCINQWSGWPVLLLVLLMIPLFYHMAGKTDFSFPCPLGVIAFGFCLVAAMMTPPLFAVGSIEAQRLQALTYAMYILMVTLGTGYAAGWFRKKAEQKKWNLDEGQFKTDADKENEENRKFSGNVAVYILFCLLFFAFASVITVIPVPYYFAFSSAITDLADGSAKAYGDARKERIAIYESGEKDVVVKELPAQPELLYFSDIKEDPEDWENRGLCRFYGLDSVRVQKELK